MPGFLCIKGHLSQSLFLPFFQDILMLGAVGAFDWSGSVVQGTSREHFIFPKQAFDHVLQDRNHSSFLGETQQGWARTTQVLLP